VRKLIASIALGASLLGAGIVTAQSAYAAPGNSGGHEQAGDHRDFPAKARADEVSAACTIVRTPNGACICV
jgi:hypothetical protein